MPLTNSHSLVHRLTKFGGILGLGILPLAGQTGTPVFQANPTVHDPSVIHVENRYYVFGSHLQAAWTSDLMNWTQISGGPKSNTLIPNLSTELHAALTWASTNTLWAPDVARLDDGRYYMYYCAAQSDAPRASIGRAVSDSVEGPYHDLGIFLQSGMWGQVSPDGTVYDANVHPNTIDAAVFTDADGLRWMVYGSYSGGIFILRLDPATGLPLAGQGYGKHLLGGYHARIEGPYILYNPHTAYYYLFVSFGGLDAAGGYNIRVARSRHPDGPYYDLEGIDMAAVKGTPGVLFDDNAIKDYGVKLMGNCRFATVSGEPRTTTVGYVSPGHNSACYDALNDKFYLFFHTRFVGRGETHEVRVHQLYFNEDGWPVVAPHRYAHETLATYDPAIIPGSYKVINHGKDITSTVKVSTTVQFQSNGTVSGGGYTGTWQLVNAHDLHLTLNGIEYRGVFSHQFDESNAVWVLAFSALSPNGTALWGSEVAEARSPLTAWREIHFSNTANAGPGADSADPDGDGLSNLLEYAIRADPLRPDAAERFVLSLPDAHLQLDFRTIMDPSLTYTLEAGDRPESGTATLWSSSGTTNRIESQSIRDSAVLSTESRRFLRLRVDRQ